MPRLNRLLALKDLGFSLEQIAQVLNEGLSLEQLRGMFRLKDEGYKTSDVDAEGVVYLKSRIPETERVKVYELRAAMMASVSTMVLTPH